MILDFWQFFLLLVIFIPLAIIWIAAVFDLFKRHDISGIAKALWLLLVILLPVAGVVIYLIARPKPPEPSEELKVPYDQSVAQDLDQLSQLRDSGALNEDEYSHAKAGVLRNITLG